MPIEVELCEIVEQRVGESAGRGEEAPPTALRRQLLVPRATRSAAGFRASVEELTPAPPAETGTPLARAMG
jgi:hypothetical protein